MNEPAAPEDSHAPLTGVRIVAVEQFGAGPFGTLLLADLGAEVIKIEDPATGGDVGRSVPPGAADGSSLYFEAFNRGKRSIALDLTSPGGAGSLLPPRRHRGRRLQQSAWRSPGPARSDLRRAQRGQPRDRLRIPVGVRPG